MIDTVLFDFAGTLFMPRFGPEQVQAAARSVGLQLSNDECRRLAGECWAAGFPGGPPPRRVPDRLRLLYDHRDLSSAGHRAAFVGLIADLQHPHPGLPEAIYDQVLQPEGWVLYADARGVVDALERRGIRMGVVSNVGFDIRPILSRHGLEALAGFCTMSYVVGAIKPDPRIFEAALHVVGSEPSTTLMIGDHAEDDRGGEALGIRTLILPMSRPGGNHGLSQALAVIEGEHPALTATVTSLLEVKLEVRRAVPEDARAIAEIHVRAWTAAYRGLVPNEVLNGLSVTQREQYWREATAGGQGAGAVVVAVRDGEVAGFCALATPSRDEDADRGTAEIGAIYVDPGDWRGGVGSALMESAVAELRAGGWRSVTLWVLAANRQARNFYSRFGFEPDGAEMCHQRSGQTEVRLRASVEATTVASRTRR